MIPSNFGASQLSLISGGLGISCSRDSACCFNNKWHITHASHTTCDDTGPNCIKHHQAIYLWHSESQRFEKNMSMVYFLITLSVAVAVRFETSEVQSEVRLENLENSQVQSEEFSQFDMVDCSGRSGFVPDFDKVKYVKVRCALKTYT